MELNWYRTPSETPWTGIMLMSEARYQQVKDRWAECGEPLTPLTEAPDLSLADQLLAYAKAHYDTGGWDVVVECSSPESLAKDVAGFDNIEDVLTKSTIATCVEIWADRQADAAVEGCTGDEYCSYHDHADDAEQCRVDDEIARSYDDI